jgi:hypothetical protein
MLDISIWIIYAQASTGSTAAGAAVPQQLSASFWHFDASRTRPYSRTAMIGHASMQQQQQQQPSRDSRAPRERRGRVKSEFSFESSAAVQYTDVRMPRHYIAKMVYIPALMYRYYLFQFCYIG